MSPAEHTVLIVDDDPAIVSLYSAILSEDYAVRGAASGREALERFDERVDVVVLDRRMEAMSGDEVLERLREVDPTVPVVMVTAVDPGLDIAEMAFDEYLVKPVEVEALRTAVGAMLRRRAYDRSLRAYFATVSKLAKLEAELPRHVLERSEEYAELQRQLAATETESRATLEALSPEDYEALLVDIGSRTSGSVPGGQ